MFTDTSQLFSQCSSSLIYGDDICFASGAFSVFIFFVVYFFQYVQSSSQLLVGRVAVYLMILNNTSCCPQVISWTIKDSSNLLDREIFQLLHEEKCNSWIYCINLFTKSHPSSHELHISWYIISIYLSIYIKITTVKESKIKLFNLTLIERWCLPSRWLESLRVLKVLLSDLQDLVFWVFTVWTGFIFYVS